MKSMICCTIIAFALTACGNATDGDPRTDTTSRSVDTVVMNHQNGAGINSEYGPDDSLQQNNVKGDVRSSSPSPLGSRKTTAGNDSTNQKK